MKKGIFILILLLTFTLTSCNKVKQHYYDQIEIGNYLEDIIKMLGKEDDKDSLFDMTHSAYYWFDKANSLDEAKRLTKEGKTIHYIIIITTTDSKGTYVIGKNYGEVYENLKPGDVNVYA